MTASSRTSWILVASRRFYKPIEHRRYARNGAHDRGGTYRLRRDWPPAAWPFSHELPFAGPGITHAHEAALVVSAALFVWSCAYLISLKALWRRPPERAFPAVIFGTQAALLLLTFVTALPFNPDQYAYVGYGELVRAGANPYAPPLKSAPLSPSLRAIGTVVGQRGSSPTRAAGLSSEAGTGRYGHRCPQQCSFHSRLSAWKRRRA
jgi:hypothetical protein